jgi:hypothetical protein
MRLPFASTGQQNNVVAAAAAAAAAAACIVAQVERALLDLCLDPSDSYMAAVAVDMGTSLAEGSVTSSVRLYEVGADVKVSVAEVYCE